MVPDNVRKWLERVEYDLQTAEAMHAAGRYIYVVFMCQQAIEKCFKALILRRGGHVFPIHNLRRLAEESGLQFDEGRLLRLDFLSQYYINARYKEDIAELSKGVTKEITADFLAFSKEMIEWLMRETK